MSQRVMKVTPTRDDLLDLILPDGEADGFRVIGYDPPCEFPDGCVAARITGPELPEGGLPFCVPEVGKDVWARRLVLTLSRVYRRGKRDEALSQLGGK